MTTTLQQNLENANLKDLNAEIFSEEDLKEFNALIKNKESFDELVKGFEDEKVIEEIKNINGLKNQIDIFVGTKKGLASIFDKTYEDAVEENKDLYEICVLGAILTKGKVENADYKVLAKEYYENINPASTTADKNIEVLPNPNYGGTFETASADIDMNGIKNDTDNTNIEMVMEQKEGQKITEITGIVSAGADIRKMDLNKAKNKHTKKIDELKKIGETFTDEYNKQEIQKIISELEDTNKIQGISNNNETQYGNCYLIAARLAEGFIKILKSVPRKPDPKLNLKIDRNTCKIGTNTNNNGDVKEDRFIGIYATATRENLIEKEEPQTYTQTNTQTYTQQSSMPQINISSSNTTTIPRRRTTVTSTGRQGGPNADGYINETYTPEVTNTNENVEYQPQLGKNPDIFINERIKIALKDRKINGQNIDITDINETNNPNKFYITINNIPLLFSCKKIQEDWNFDKDEEGNLKKADTNKNYYKVKLESTEHTDGFKAYTIKESNKNIQITLNETKTKELFIKFYAFKEQGYSIDKNNIIIQKDATGDVEKITTNLIYQLPQSILEIQDKGNTIKQDTIENVVFDKHGNLIIENGNVYKKYTGKETITLQTKEKNQNDIYTKEKKHMQYYIKVSDKNITIINDEIQIHPTTKIADRKDNRMASEVENGERTQKQFEGYTTDLDENFKKRNINALGGDKYEVLGVPNIPGVKNNQYIKIPFNYKLNEKQKSQTRYFIFDNKNISVPEKYRDNTNKNYFVIDGLYYKIDVPSGEQTSINPKITLDYDKTKEVALKKTQVPSVNEIKATKEEFDNNNGGRQNINIAGLNNITYNKDGYLDFNIDEATKTITYTREIYLDEALGFELNEKNKLILGTIKFNGKGEIIETEDRHMKVNKRNQTLEIKDIFGRNKTLTIPFEIKNNRFVIGNNTNPEAKYIVEEFEQQKIYLKNRIYDEKSAITNKLNEGIKEIGTQRASEFPGLALITAKGLWGASNKETIDAFKYLKGPTSTGLYYLEIDNSYKGEKKQRDTEFLYFKVSREEVKLTDMNGKEIEEIYLQSNKEYKPGKGLIRIKNDLTIESVKDITEQEKGYPNLENKPETVKEYLTKTVADADTKNYDKETQGKYLRIFGNSKIGHITSIPIQQKEGTTNKYIYNQEGLKSITSEEMATDLRDYETFEGLKMINGLKESELKEIFTTKFTTNKNIDKATNGNNIRIKNSKGKFEYRRIEYKNNENIKFSENDVAKKIQEKVINDMKKDLAILGSIEHIKFKYRRSDEKKKTITPRDKAGNRTIKDIEKQKTIEFITKDETADKKINLQLLGPANDAIYLDINDKVYDKISYEDLKNNGYYDNIFESQLGDGTEKEITVKNETYKTKLTSNNETKEYWIIFESQVSSTIK